MNIRISRTWARTLALLVLLGSLSVFAAEVAEEEQPETSAPTEEVDASTPSEEPEDSTEPSGEPAEEEKEPVPESKLTTEAALQAELEEHDMVILEFYKPDCPYCKQIQPEIDKLLVEGSLPLFQVDCSNPESESLCATYIKEGVPDIRYIGRGFDCSHDAARTSDAIKDRFENIKSNEVSFESVTISDIQPILTELLEPVPPVQAEPAEGEEPSEPEPTSESVLLLAMSSAASPEDRQKYSAFFRCNSLPRSRLLSIASLPESDQKLIMTRTWLTDSEEHKTAELSTRYEILLSGPNDLLALVTLNRRVGPLTPFNPMLLQFIAPLGHPLLIIVPTKSDDKFVGTEELEIALKENRENRLGRAVVAFTFDSEDAQFAQTIKMLGLDSGPEDIGGRALVIDLANRGADKLPKFRMEEPLGTESMRNFLRRFAEGTLPHFMKSAPVPEYKEDTVVYEVVGKNFDEFVEFGEGKAVVVISYVAEAPKDSKSADKALEVAKELADASLKFSADEGTDEKLKVGTFDIMMNEHERIKPSMKPSLRLFAKGHEEGVEFEGFMEKDMDEIKKWIKEKSGIALVHVEEEEGSEL